jgi:hypothetical protein
MASDGFPALSEPIVTDVTPSSFSVAWYSGEDSDPSLKIYLDENGTEELTGAALAIQPTMDPDSTAGAAAATEGVLKVRAAGLSPDTTYYFQTATLIRATEETVLIPSSPPFPSVRTQLDVVRQEGTVPFSNDLCAVEVYVSDTFTTDECGLAIALFQGSSHPISAFLGDSIYPTLALLDLNNLFAKETGKNLFLSGGQTVTIYFITKAGVSDGAAYRLYDPSGLSAPQIDIPFFGDFVGSYGVEVSDAVAGLQVLANEEVEIKAIEGISPTPRRGMGEIVYVLQRLSQVSRP